MKLHATPISCIKTTDPELVVATSSYHGKNGFGMDRFDLEPCFIWLVRGGLIVNTADYLGLPVQLRD